jgi:hypothetical protein
MKNNSNLAYPKQDLATQKKDLLILRDSSIAMNYGRLNNDKRIQVTMPGVIVEMIDRLFPNAERNKILTKAIINFLSKEIQTNYKINVKDLLQEEQKDMDEMWSYLNDLDQGKI